MQNGQLNGCYGVVKVFISTWWFHSCCSCGSASLKWWWHQLFPISYSRNQFCCKYDYKVLSKCFHTYIMNTNCYSQLSKLRNQMNFLNVLSQSYGAMKQCLSSSLYPDCVMRVLSPLLRCKEPAPNMKLSHHIRTRIQYFYKNVPMSDDITSNVHWNIIVQND